MNALLNFSRRAGRRATVALLLAGLLPACGGGGGSGGEPPAPQGVADVNLLFFGNSHTHGNGLPNLVFTLVQAARPALTVSAVAEPKYMFLDERLPDPQSLELFASRRWQAVVLQAQRYSSSGAFNYSTAEAVAWVHKVRSAGGVPVLFPEWPRRGINETERIYALHRSIALAAAACVAPIPQAFDAAAALNPQLALHAADGNHSSPAGALLAAMVIATTLTGRAPLEHPLVLQGEVSAADQATLRQAAAAAVSAVSPWSLCPADRPAGAL